MLARALTLLIVVALWGPAQASSHAAVRSVEGDARALTVVLDAAAETAFLRASGGGTVRIDPGDDHVLHLTVPPEGTTVRVLSTDGHVSHLGFDLGGRVTAVARMDDPTVVAGRALIIGALTVMVGLVGMLAVVVAPALRAPIRPPGVRDARLAEFDAPAPPGFSVIRSILVRTAVLGLVGVLLVIAGTMGALGAGAGSLGTLLVDTRLGLAALGWLAAIGVALALAVALGRRGRPRSWWPWALGLPPAVALVILSWSGHAMSGNDRALSVGLDTLHLVATCLWFGGLVGLVVATAVGRRMGDPVRVLPTLAAIVVRFSAMALIAVGVLVVTGVYRALAELSAVGDLVHTRYGIALLVKLGVFGVMLCIAAYNRFVIHPRLERAALGLADDDRGAGRALGASVRAELTLAAVLIVTVAVMISLPPP